MLLVPTEPENIFETYISILEQMDFNDEEIEMIAHGNIETLLGL